MTSATQTAVQLVGPDQLTLTAAKPVLTPGPRQILARVECVGLCQSDMKLLHQFGGHARKSPVLAHLGADILSQIPTYVPDGAPTVPGHEAVVRVTAVGPGVTSVAVGKRYLVQADWRDLKTAGSNGAFGYNFEGGLQQYVLLDERTTVASDGTSYLVPVPDDRSASQLALVEPWACVEEAFIHCERQQLKTGGTCLLVVSPGVTPDLSGLDLERPGRRLIAGAALPRWESVELAKLPARSVDDLLFIGGNGELLEQAMPLLANEGLGVIAQAGVRFRRLVQLPVGRVHYGNVRFIGHPSNAPARALARIPASGEVRPGDHVHVVGAAGPMGSMVVIRLCSLGRNLSIEAGDRSQGRVEVLRRKAQPVADRQSVALRCYDATVEAPEAYPDYSVLMVPVAALVSAAVSATRPLGIINLFGGIPADVSEGIDLDIFCGRGQYFIGTSGSTMEDMLVVLDKVLTDQLDTNLSVAAVSGMRGAIDGLDAVKHNRIAGKILVYPELPELPLTTLESLVDRFPTIKPLLLDNGGWTKAAEEELLRVGRGAERGSE